MKREALWQPSGLENISAHSHSVKSSTFNSGNLCECLAFLIPSVTKGKILIYSVDVQAHCVCLLLYLYFNGSKLWAPLITRKVFWSSKENKQDRISLSRYFKKRARIPLHEGCYGKAGICLFQSRDSQEI